MKTFKTHLKEYGRNMLKNKVIKDLNCQNSGKEKQNTFHSIKSK